MPDIVVPTTTPAPAPNPYPLCLNCKNYDGKKYCISTAVQFAVSSFPIDLVTGASVVLAPLDARTLRYGGVCGALGKYFVPK